MNVLVSFDQEWKNVQNSRLKSIADISASLTESNYIFKNEVANKLKQVESRLQSLEGKSEAKRSILNGDLELEKKKEQLRLDYAGACSDFVLYANDQAAICGVHYFGDTLTAVEQHESTLTSQENDISDKVRAKKQNALNFHKQLTDLSVADFNYTTVNPEEIDAVENKFKEAIQARRDAYNKELAKQRYEDDLCRSYAKKIEEYTAWLTAKKSSSWSKYLKLRTISSLSS